tara:strand:+ start:1814 stop:1969 length:156 start_codon:yes stop_codon:yes gene_type:complete
MSSPNYMNLLAMSCMVGVAHPVGILTDSTLEILATPKVLSDTETAVENFKA